MNYRVTLRRDGKKLSIDLPPEAEAALGAAAGETVELAVVGPGRLEVKGDAQIAARAKAAFDDLYARYESTFRELAK